MNNSAEKLNIHGRRGISRELAVIVFAAFLWFVSAGTLNWARGWIYIVLAFLYQIVYISTLLTVSPQLLNERGKLNWNKTRFHDKCFTVLYPIFGFSAIIAAGLDAVRYKLSYISSIAIYPGVVLFVFASFISLWAYVSNSSFILTHRDDKVSNQKICTKGPYKYVRHPAYFAGIISLICLPLIVGSWLSFIPVLFNVVLLVIRTYHEDKALQKELKGYSEYSLRTKYKLFPYLW